MQVDQPSVSAHGRISLRDSLYFSAYSYYRRWFFWFFLTFSILLLVVNGRLYSLGYLSFSLVLFAALLVVYPLVVIPLWLYFSTRRHLETYHSARKEHHFVFSTEGVASRSESGSGLMKWEDFYRVCGNRRALFLYVSNKLAVVIPAHFFERPEDMEYAVELMRSTVTPKQFRIRWPKKPLQVA